MIFDHFSRFWAVVETLGFSRLLNLENDTKSYTSHSSIFLGLICDIFGSLRFQARFRPFSAILEIFGSLWFKGPFSVIFRVQQGGPLPKWPATPDFSIFEIYYWVLVAPKIYSARTDFDLKMTLREAHGAYY